ncbi:hypothetical protein SAMN06295905_3544 [Devosia lucknowensis]|uniref:Uncharacterized protein n=2 Tax=Devosia lucknowensis TaxID=1096929 RepID=A0A1Y6GEI9_9HYPH|nr:hypothetical protein SAMN06295905_3544 [Devosia lucknowensis]
MVQAVGELGFMLTANADLASRLAAEGAVMAEGLSESSRCASELAGQLVADAHAAEEMRKSFGEATEGADSLSELANAMAGSDLEITASEQVPAYPPIDPDTIATYWLAV